MSKPSELVKYAVTIQKPREELYGVWRNFENLPSFSPHLKTVRNLDGVRSEWTTDGPTGPVKWTARMNEDIPNQQIAWKSEEGSMVDNHGVVQFADAPGGRGTEVRVYISYHAAGGVVGKAIANVTGNDPKQEVAEMMRRFKCLQECGELPVVEGQPSNRMRSDNAPGEKAPKVGLR